MAQSDYNVENASGAIVRADINSIYSASKTSNSGATAPPSAEAFQLWGDSSNDLLRVRAADNNSWINVAGLSDRIETITSNRVVNLTDYGKVFLVNNTNSVTIELTDIAGDFNIIVKKIGTGEVTVEPSTASTRTIDGATSLSITNTNDTIQIHGDGTNWYTTASFGGAAPDYSSEWLTLDDTIRTITQADFGTSISRIDWTLRKDSIYYVGLSVLSGDNGGQAIDATLSSGRLTIRYRNRGDIIARTLAGTGTWVDHPADIKIFVWR